MSLRQKVWRFSLVDAEALSTETLAPSVAAVARARWLLAPLLSPGTTTRIKSEIHCQSSSEPSNSNDNSYVSDCSDPDCSQK